MELRSLRWANPEQTALIINDESIVRMSGDARAFYVDEYLAAGGRIDPFRDFNDARRIRVLEVKAEARRRILALVPGCTLENRDEKQINALMQAVLRLFDAVALLVEGNPANARAILRELDPLADKARKIIAIRDASDRFEDLVMNSPADPVSWDLCGTEMWP